ncbi:MAG: S41 family peptidase [Ruminococcus sp.]|nr:S41 family peptidase [Ruminococcus sp.]
MSNKTSGFSLIWVMCIVIVTSIVSGITTGVIVYNNNKITNKVTYADLINDKELNDFLKVYASITSEYYENIDKEEMLDKAIDAMMSYLGDDYTSYLNGEATDELLEKLAGEYKGIGIAINNEDKSITKVYENTPASKAGVQIGDIIVGFNEIDATTMDASELTNKIKNTNDYFTLKLKRNEEIVEVSIKSEKIISPSIEYNMIENTTIGYLYIETFSKTLGTQVKSALNNLENSGMTALIIDVRNNTGGYLTSADEVASFFLEKNKIIYSLSYKNDVTNYKDKTDEHRSYDIIVLANGNSASASEILAAALVESYGARIVGETTFGKGRVQETMELNDGSMVKYTSAYWLTPNGNCIDEIGISPNYYVKNETVADESGNTIEIIDHQLEKAIDLLRNDNLLPNP